jgi:penicillin-binding protein-related factor A (putative recombinase)
MFNHLPGIGKILLLAIICSAHLKIHGQSIALSKTTFTDPQVAAMQETTQSKSLKFILDDFERSYKVYFHYESDLIKIRK